MQRGRAWMLAIVLLLLAQPITPEENGQYRPLFDGETLNGWKLVGQKGVGYLVKDGLLVCPKDGGGNLYTEEEFSDFSLSFEFRLEAGGNSGVGIRSPLAGDAAYVGMEIQIIDNSNGRWGKLRPWQEHGSIYNVVPARTGHLRKPGEWNTEQITARGRQITVVLNGVTIVDADLDTIDDPKVLKKHPGLARRSGHIGFLGHGTLVEFRDIRIKTLD